MKKIILIFIPITLFVWYFSANVVYLGTGSGYDVWAGDVHVDSLIIPCSHKYGLPLPIPFLPLITFYIPY